MTPAQYERLDDDVVILVGRPGSRNWWRNLRGGHDRDAHDAAVLLDRR